jgi:catechol 2,3-dioxygenase-like lactoylglutathione lyase family enzyme
METSMFENLGKVIHWVSDMARAKAFYTGALGLKATSDYGDWVELGTKGATLCLHGGAKGRNPATEGTAKTVTGIQVDDLKKAIATLAERGVKPNGKPHQIHGPIHVISVSDPDGNLIDISGPM